MHLIIQVQDIGLVVDQCHDVWLENQGTSPVQSALYHPSGHPLNHVQLVLGQNSSVQLIVGKANSIGVPHFRHHGMPQHTEDQGRIPLQMLASTMLMFHSWIKDIGLLPLHCWKVTHRFPSFHFCIVETNERSKVLERSNEVFLASHPRQTLILHVNFKSGIELMNNGLIPIVPKLHHLVKTHDPKLLDQVLDAWEVIQIGLVDPLTLLHWPVDELTQEELILDLVWK